jgi:hypothetical protein
VEVEWPLMPLVWVVVVEGMMIESEEGVLGCL